MACLCIPGAVSSWGAWVVGMQMMADAHWDVQRILLLEAHSTQRPLPAKQRQQAMMLLHHKIRVSTSAWMFECFHFATSTILCDCVHVLYTKRMYSILVRICSCHLRASAHVGTSRFVLLPADSTKCWNTNSRSMLLGNKSLYGWRIWAPAQQNRFSQIRHHHYWCCCCNVIKCSAPGKDYDFTNARLDAIRCTACDHHSVREEVVKPDCKRTRNTIVIRCTWHCVRNARMK